MLMKVLMNRMNMLRKNMMNKENYIVCFVFFFFLSGSYCKQTS